MAGRWIGALVEWRSSPMLSIHQVTPTSQSMDIKSAKKKHIFQLGNLTRGKEYFGLFLSSNNLSCLA